MESNFNTLKLHNHYFVLRHGESEANAAGIITSDPAQCLENYGLTDHGREIVTASVKKAIENGWLSSKTILYSSDFKRALQTAEIARDITGAGKIHTATDLRERNFGSYNLKHVNFYIEIWPKNRHEETLHKENGVEDAISIAKRTSHIMAELESRYENQQILLVTHGDVIQVLQATAAHLTPEQGRVYPYTQPGQIRELKKQA